MRLEEFAVLSTWPRRLSRGTGIAMALGNLTRAIGRAGVEVTFPLPTIDPAAKMGIERTRRQLEAGSSMDVPLPPVALGIDIDGHHIPGRSAGGSTLKIVHVRTNFIELETICSPDEVENMQLRAEAQRENLATADAVVTTSQYTLDHLRRHFDGLPERAMVLPNALDEQLGHHLTNGDTPRDAEPMVIGYGSANWRKDFITALEASAELTRRGIDHKVELLTYGTLLPELKAWVRHNQAANVSIRPTISDRKRLASLLRRAWVVCHPAIQEDFGNVYLEGPAAGAPVAATRNQITVEHGLEPAAGSLAGQHDPIAFADSMQTLIERRMADRTAYQPPLATTYSGWTWDDAAADLLKFATWLDES